ncbi:BZ3500_MvSof-1268-A1-R1_Chr10-1g02531 [Microbotryum saponariae]|uniref:BZ3500_MvSof-1268-A1-R1_Chr10-1g02531 protein n=1 Tax=Microbotryum saponariae TaxID=289078 RepID=A0A2X0LL90_9BASI|nr:BZ3500_MvSof-1268-A1-R1_Chr10-1g02531 [Microbotryum saponariae]SDA02294.1 BZ3501_MvSof-1269-A2-R1_C52g00282 [Microbotryum saponariae]SDA06020.1 BZ3501_MvSof-1269-A2-R1_Chr10-1g02132 [Microbotryum saponariae]
MAFPFNEHAAKQKPLVCHLACEANVMDPSFTRAVRLVSGFIGQFAALSSSLVAKLTLPELDEDVDLCFIEDEIVPRVVICSASDLVHSALGFDATQFKRQAQDALARPGRSEVQVLFDKDCRRSPDQRVADWVLPLADFASGGSHRQNNLKVAHAERQARLTLGGGACRLQHVERHHFLTCCDELGSGNNGTGTHSMLVPLAFGVRPPSDLSTLTVPPLINVVLDLARDALTQPARMYAPGLAIRDDTAYFVVLDHEGCRIAIIPDCWGEGFGELASVLSVLLGLEVYSAGLSPLFRYAHHPKTGIAPVAFRTLYLRPSELEADAPLVGRTVEFVAEEPVKLVDCRVAGGSSIFGRCTVIFELTRPSLVQGSLSTSGLSPSFVLKIQHINQKSKGCEADVLDKIVQCRTSHAPSASSLLIERHVPLPEKATSLGLHRSQMDDSALPVLMDPVDPERRLRESCRSTLDLLIVRNPTPLPIRVDTGRGPQHKLSQACEVFDQLLTLLPALWDLGIHHRDLSLGNVLHYQGHLVLVDWDTGIVAQPGTRVPIAADVGGSFRITDATASQEVLNYPRGLVNGCYKVPPHALRHDFESSVYWFLHGLQLRPLSNEATLPLACARLELWEGGYCPEVRQAFLEDLANVDSGLHDLVKFMTCAHPGSLPPFATGDRRHHRCVKQKMVQVQAELRRMLEGAQQPDYGGVLGRYHRLLKLQ